MVEVQTFRFRDVIQGDFSVDGLDDGDLQFRLVGHGTHAEVFRTFYFVFLDVFLDELNKLLAETFSLSCAHTRDVLELLDGDRVGGGHRL